VKSVYRLPLALPLNAGELRVASFLGVSLVLLFYKDRSSVFTGPSGGSIAGLESLHLQPYAATVPPALFLMWCDVSRARLHQGLFRGSPLSTAPTVLIRTRRLLLRFVRTVM